MKFFLRLSCSALFLLATSLGAAAPSPAGRTKVVYWEKWTAFEQVSIQKLVDKFNASQEKIWVDLVVVSGIDQKTLVATAGGVPPDISGLWEHNIPAFAEKNALTALDEFLPGSGIGPETYIPAAWHVCTYKGKTWGLISTPAPIALHWNKKLFREAGLDPERPPRTFAEMDEFSRKLVKTDPKTGHITQMGFVPMEPGWWQWSWGYFFGGGLWDGGAKVLADTPENEKAFEWIQSCSKLNGVDAVQVFRSGFGNFASPQNPFMNGTLAMIMQGVWFGRYISEYAPNLEWGAAPMPVLKAGAAPVTWLACDMLVIPHGAKHPKEAFEFMAFLTRQENIEELNLAHAKTSPLRKVSDHFYAVHKNPYIRMFQKLSWSPNATAAPQMSIFKEYDNEMKAAVEEVWLMKKTPALALVNVQERIQKSWDRELERRKHPSSNSIRLLPLSLTALLVLGLGLALWRQERQDYAATRAGRIRGKLRRGLLFASPALLGLLAFTLYPLACALVYSFCDYSVLETPRWIGLANFKELAQDELFWRSMKNTFYYALMAIPMSLLVALACALLLDSNVRGVNSFRTFFFLPVVTPLVANAIVWMWIFNTQYGVLNHVLETITFGLIKSVPWLTDVHFAMPSLVLMGFWGVGNTVVILMAGLQEVPVSLYEAAELDGAGWWRKIWSIAVPSISPVLYFSMVMGIIGSLQVFALPYIMTGGGPARATYFYTMYLWDNAFSYLRMGYACAMAWILFIAILAITSTLKRLTKSQVHYTGD
jgi:ABC-type sugar transport system permease subunit/ABC-type glycerol-3-phosphate transport system substrate-binding protein